MVDSITENNGDIDPEKNEIITELDQETKERIISSERELRILATFEKRYQ